MAAFNSFFLSFRVARVLSELVTNSRQRTPSNFLISSFRLTIVRSTRFSAWQVFLVGGGDVVVSVVLEEDESGSAGLKTTMMMRQLLGSKILLLGMREEFLHLLIPKVLIFPRKKVMCFSDVSVYTCMFPLSYFLQS